MQSKMHRQQTDSDILFRYALPAGFGLAAVLLNLYITSGYGIGLDADSASYLSAARNLVAGRGAVCFDGTPLTSWPPLYPALLALLELVSRDVLALARYVHALVMGGMAYAAFHVLRGALRSRVVIVAGAVLVTTSPTLQFVSAQLLSDAVFCLLTVMYILVLSRLLTRRDGKTLALCALLGALLCLQRYAGIPLVVAAGTAVLVWERGAFLRRLARVIGLVLSSLVPLGAWLARNYMLTSSLTGTRVFAAQSFVDKLGLTLNVLGNWFYPRIDDPVLGWAAGLLLAAALSALATLALRRARKDRSEPTMTVRSSAVLAGTYLSALVVLSLVASVQLSPRLLSPAFVPVVVVVLAGVEALGCRLQPKQKGPKSGSVLAPALAVLLVLYPLYLSARTARLLKDMGVGVYALASRLSPLVAWLRQNPVRGSVFSNDPAVMYLFLEQESRFTPRRSEDPEAMYREGDIQPDDHIVWFKGMNRPYLYSLEELSLMLPLEPVHTARDGVVLRVGRSAAR
ncbi:MAG: glycosyltransferase family 39 protein [candidate division WOR-3 bacterium]|nr:MAG: glycosyltransferase family 39 protein [candidate division WOR-3 bacterium]